jgi:hypothetical protein
MHRAMPEATILYAVTAAVIAGLVIWLATVLATAKVAWARPAPPPVLSALQPDAPLIGAAPPPPEAPAPPAEAAPEQGKTEGS